MKKVPGVNLINMPSVKEDRGKLTALELVEIVPFYVKRIFIISQVSNFEIRGKHAHKKCWQFLISTSGSVTVDVSDGVVNETYVLNKPDVGLLIPPLIWGAQYNFTEGSSLLVLASERFDPSDYLNNFEEFKEFRRTKV
jgi:UDP-2-acetamido-3-amino-2,3-dideoxy-glucuronate N-acetyltransferase